MDDLSCDDILKMEVKIQKRLLKLYKSKFFSKEIYESGFTVT